MKYDQIVDGETVYPARRGYKMMCCDCGLVHRINFRLVPFGKNGKRKKIALNAYRDERATANARRKAQVKR